MANLTGTQKKKRNQFIALLVAIAVVLAAIFYVVFSAYMAKSAYLANEDFATALATALDKSVRSVSKDDLASVKFLEVINDGEQGAITLGDKDFADKYAKYLEETEAKEKAEEAKEENIPEVTPLDTSTLKFAQFEIGEEAIVLDDLKYFTGIENAAFSGIEFNADDLSGFSQLARVNFSGCNLTNEHIASLAKGLNLEAVEELTFASEYAIDDWSPLESISDKVIIQDYDIQIDENGQYTVVPTEKTLTDYLAAKAEEEAKAAEEAAKAEAEAEAGAEAETAEETTDTEPEADGEAVTTEIAE